MFKLKFYKTHGNQCRLFYFLFFVLKHIEFNFNFQHMFNLNEVLYSGFLYEQIYMYMGVGVERQIPFYKNVCSALLL